MNNTTTLTALSRRDLLALTGLAAAGLAAKAHSATPVSGSLKYPKGFLWGVSTAGHQVEGSNVNSDIWHLEHTTPTIYAESSGDACDQYHRYRDDIALVAQLGFNCYRFSLEWSRIEPAQGEFLFSELEHYRKVIATCHEFGLAPMVTYNHFATPRWFAAKGGWESAESPDFFARFCERATAHLGDLITVASTLNEPNLGLLFGWLGLPKAMYDTQAIMLANAAKAAGSDRFSALTAGDANKMLPNLLVAHQKGYAAIKSGRGEFPVGMNLAIVDDQAVGDATQRDRKRADVYEPWLKMAAAHSDYVGVQTYGRARLGKEGTIPPEAGVELTQMGEEFYPEGLEGTIRYAAKVSGKPVYVTENGIATENDQQRVEYIKRAVAGVERCLADGVDVRSYMHWSLLDNFEWIFGYRPKFGLVAVDRKTQLRTVKPSAKYLGGIAQARGSRAAVRK